MNIEQKRQQFWSAALLMVVIGTIVVPELMPFQADTGPLREQFLQPSGEHPFGTDHVGRDMFVLVFYSGRISLLTAALATTIAMSLSMLVGGLAGAFQGVLDWVFMRGVDVFLAFPGLLLALTVIAVLDAGHWQGAVAVGIALTPVGSRLFRAAIISVRSRGFVEIARSFGAGPWWVFCKHILPNISGQLIAFGSVLYAWSLLNISALDFLGVLGLEAIPGWGRLLGEGRNYMRVAPWIALAPGVLLMLTVMAVIGVTDAWRRMHIQ